MPQHVWMHIGGDSLACCPHFQPLADRTPAPIFTVPGYEKRCSPRLDQVLAVADPIAQSKLRLAADRNNARLAAFARDPYRAFRKAQTPRLHTREFGEPQSGGVTQLEQGFVPQCHYIVTDSEVQQLRGFVR